MRICEVLKYQQWELDRKNSNDIVYLDMIAEEIDSYRSDEMKKHQRQSSAIFRQSAQMTPQPLPKLLEVLELPSTHTYRSQIVHI